MEISQYVVLTSLHVCSNYLALDMAMIIPTTSNLNTFSDCGMNNVVQVGLFISLPLRCCCLVVCFSILFLSYLRLHPLSLLHCMIYPDTSVKERSRYTGMLAVAQALGNSCGFLFGSMFSGVNFFPNSFFAIDEYNAPGYFSVLLGLANIAMVMVLMMDKKEYLERKPYELVHGPDHYTGLLSGSDSFAEEGQEGTVLQVMSDIVNVDDEEEKEEVEKEEEEEEEGDVENVENSVLEEPVTVPWKEVLQCCYLYFSIICVLSLIETLQAPFMIDNYGWSVFNIGMVGMIGGLVGTCCVVVVPYVREVVGIRPTIAVTLLLMAGVLDVATYPWAPSSVAPVWYFILMITVIFIGFSITIFTVTYGLSLILYKLDQGLYTGYMVSSGSFARILGPVWATELYSLNTQGRYAFPATGFICFIGFIVAGTVKWTHPDEVSAWRRERERVKERDKERTGQIRDIDSPTREHGWSSTVTDMMPNEL